MHKIDKLRRVARMKMSIEGKVESNITMEIERWEIVKGNETKILCMYFVPKNGQ